MLFVYFGDDENIVRKEALKNANSLVVSDGEVSLVTGEMASADLLRDALGTISLFRAHEVFVLDSLAQDEGFLETLTELAPLMAESHNQFVIIEGPLLAAPKKVFTKYAEICTEFKKVKKEFNAFAMSDALTARDKKTLWILLQDAWKEGRSNEELIGTLFWQLKMLRLAEVTTSALEAGQKPFVYEKAKRGVRNFKEGEITRLSQELVTLYHEGHAGKRVLSSALESWVLTL